MDLEKDPHMVYEFIYCLYFRFLLKYKSLLYQEFLQNVDTF